MLNKYFIQCLTPVCLTLGSLSSTAATINFDLTNPDVLPDSLTDSISYTNNEYGISLTATGGYTKGHMRNAQQSSIYFDPNYGLGEKHGDENHPDRYSIDGYGLPSSDSDFIRLEFSQAVNMESFSLGLIDSDSDSDIHVFVDNANGFPIALNPGSTLDSTLAENTLTGRYSDSFSKVWYISSYNIYYNIYSDLQFESFLVDSVTVKPVPVPGALVLFMSAIAGLFGVTRVNRPTKKVVTA